MACLEDIPKYAFGTAYAIEPEEDECALAPGSGEPPAAGSSGEKAAVPAGPGPERANRFTAGQVKQLVAEAIRLGCRHFDCAPLYRTQPLIGSVMREVTQRVPRQQFFFTSKVPPNMMRPENIERSVRGSIEQLQVSYLDLVLIHAPFSVKHLSDELFFPLDDQANLLLDDTEPASEECLLELAWRKLAELKAKGLARYIGLSNVNLDQITRMNDIHQVDVVQNEYHIYNQNRDILDHCEEIGVHFEAYAAFGSPLLAIGENRPSCFNDPIVKRVADENGLSIAQVIVQWIHQQPLSYVVRCDNLTQLQENLLATRNMVLPVNDLIDLDTLNRDVRIYYFDEHKGVEKHREYPFKRVPAGGHQRQHQMGDTRGLFGDGLGSS